MEYLKDIFNFKENKKYKVTIMILTMIIIILQTRLSFTNNKMKILNARISKASINNEEVASNVDELISSDKEDISNSEIDEKFQEEKERLIKKYAKIAEENNKNYSYEIVTGKEILVFESMTLSMTDGQIKKSLEKISSDNFGINIVQDEIGSKLYYKIYLIEK